MSGGVLFGREYTLLVYPTTPSSFSSTPTPTATIIRELRVQFSIEKHNGSEPNKGTIIVTNAAEATRDEMCTLPLAVQLIAGYGNHTSHVFTGDLRYGSSEQKGADIETSLQLADGDRAFRYASMNRSYAAGTSVLTVARDLARSMGLRLPASVERDAAMLATFDTGAVLSGATRDELSRVLSPFGYEWSIQGGKLQVLREPQLRENESYVISAQDGMIGEPAWVAPEKSGKPSKVAVKTALRPELEPGCRVEIRSRKINGMFKLDKATLTGDTHGGPWECALVAKPVGRSESGT